LWRSWARVLDENPDAIDNANSNDTILSCGTYTENLVINKSIALIVKTERQHRFYGFKKGSQQHFFCKEIPRMFSVPTKVTGNPPGYSAFVPSSSSMRMS